jgi:fused signal recognition particle receptor
MQSAEPETQTSEPPETEPQPQPSEPQVPSWQSETPEATKHEAQPPASEPTPEPIPEIEIPPLVTPPQNDLLDGIEFPMEAAKDNTQPEPQPTNKRPTVTQKQVPVSSSKTEGNQQ